MAVNTTADDNLENAKIHVQRGMSSLADIVINKCYGSEEYTSDAKERFLKALNLMIEAQNLLEG